MEESSSVDKKVVLSCGVRRDRIVAAVRTTVTKEGLMQLKGDKNSTVISRD